MPYPILIPTQGYRGSGGCGVYHINDDGSMECSPRGLGIAMVSLILYIVIGVYILSKFDNKIYLYLGILWFLLPFILLIIFGG